MENTGGAAPSLSVRIGFRTLCRTDARGVSGFDDAVKRARLYLAAGADGIFPEALESADEFAGFARQVPTVLLATESVVFLSARIARSGLGSCATLGSTLIQIMCA